MRYTKKLVVGMCVRIDQTPIEARVITSAVNPFAIGKWDGLLVKCESLGQPVRRINSTILLYMAMPVLSPSSSMKFT